ncbi:hypothetical protein JTB14_035279 [Gonioctena quinquepunctata]|nr:hypothetical protein JTB14_035279 [Gonioctena quinquepunctata]
MYQPNVFVYFDDVVIVEGGQYYCQHRKIPVLPSSDEVPRVVDRNGLHVDSDKVKAMLELPTPTNVTEVRRIVGNFSWLVVIAPIPALLRKRTSFPWSEESASAFRRIKECLVSASILSCPDYSREFVVQTDASGYGVGAVLTQPHDEGDPVICYLSRSLSRQERNYTTTERECLAVLWAVEKLRPYLKGVPFTVVTDHFSLLWLQTLEDLNGRLARWAIRLQQYNFEVIHRKEKENVVPDALSRSVSIVDSMRIDSCSVEDQVLTGTTEDKWYQAMVEKLHIIPEGAIHTSRHEVTKLTPYFVNFGRNMVLSGADYGRDALREIEGGTQTGEGTKNEAFLKMFQDVWKRLEVASEKSCDRYNLRRRHEKYLSNPMVWKRNYE